MTKDKQKIVVIGCINLMPAVRDYLKAMRENTDIVIEYRGAEGGFRGLNYDNIIIDDWLNEVTEQELLASATISLQPTNPNFAKESWRKKK